MIILFCWNLKNKYLQFVIFFFNFEFYPAATFCVDCINVNQLTKDFIQQMLELGLVHLFDVEIY